MRVIGGVKKDAVQLRLPNGADPYRCSAEGNWDGCDGRSHITNNMKKTKIIL
jgi:hypothetical protein